MIETIGEFNEHYDDTMKWFSYNQCSMKLIDNIEEFREKYKEVSFFKDNKVSEKVLEYFLSNYNDSISNLHYEHISFYQVLSISFINKHSDILNWYWLFRNEFIYLPDSLIEGNIYHFNIHEVSRFNVLDTFAARSYRIILNKLIEKYPHKYEIDKLTYELNSTK